MGYYLTTNIIVDDNHAQDSNCVRSDWLSIIIIQKEMSLGHCARMTINDFLFQLFRVTYISKVLPKSQRQFYSTYMYMLWKKFLFDLIKDE